MIPHVIESYHKGQSLKFLYISLEVYSYEIYLRGSGMFFEPQFKIVKNVQLSFIFQPGKNVK